MDIIFLNEDIDQKDKPSITKEILRLASRYGGVTSSELKDTLSTCDVRVCSQCFRELRKMGQIKKYWYITEEEYRWVFTA